MSRYGTYDLKNGFIPDDDCPEPQKPQTNGDKIRTMTDIELAEWVISGCDPFPEEWCIKHHKGEDGCIQCWLDWLEQEAEEEGET